MLTFSSDVLPTYQTSGRTLRIHWDPTDVMVGDLALVQQYEAVADIAADYATLVSAIIRARYTLDAELAAINNGGEQYAAYQAFREEAKALAKGYLAQRDATLSVPVEDVSVAEAPVPTPDIAPPSGGEG